MTGLVWLASYPKSGNTWFRLLVANLSATDAPTDINAMGERGGIASARGEFDYHTLLESGLMTHDEIEALRPRVYELLGKEGQDPHDARLLKAHDAYLMTPLGEPMLRAAGGAIVIVRDPRDIAASLANHRRTTIDEAIVFMGDRNAVFSANPRSQPQQLRQRLLDWSGHVASWLDQADIPVHLVRYEDLQSDPLTTFTAAMAFAGRTPDRAALERAIEYSRFERLQAQERERGFVEWRSRNAATLFFRRGQSQGWRSELNAEQVRRIESVHGSMMARLGYRPSAERDVRRARSDVE
ncbi:MAG TPA: sulfotransferase domain-containing protein [Caulobacteraceae bacterium]|nr:sulfotransferase domain-containing protein [Caulobacteraceae bacterium]